MKKKALLLLTAILICLTLTGCSKKDRSKKIVVDVMGYGDNTSREGKSWVRIVDDFEKANPDIDISYEMLFDEAYHQKVVARIASGKIPHLAYMGADARWGAPWKEAGQQYDHRPIIDKEYFEEKLIPAMGPNSEVWIIPMGSSNITTVLYMNQALVQELGFETPQTYADIVKMVPAARARGIEVITIDGADGWAWGSCLLSMAVARLSGDPHWVRKAVKGEYKFTDPVFVDALKFIQTMINDGVISKKSVLVDYGTNVTNYNSKKALFMIQGQWISGSIEDVSVADQTKMLAWPRIPGQKGCDGSVAAAIQVGYALTQKGVEDKDIFEAARKFLYFLHSHAETEIRFREGSIVSPILKNFQLPDDLPPIIIEKFNLAQKVLYTDVIDAYLSGAANDAINSGAQKIVTGQATPLQIAEEVEKLVRP